MGELFFRNWLVMICFVCRVLMELFAYMCSNVRRLWYLDSPLVRHAMCALFDTLLFELDREIVDRFKACMACFWTAADRMVESSTMKPHRHCNRKYYFLAEIPLVTGICAVEFEPPNLVVWGPEIL